MPRPRPKQRAADALLARARERGVSNTCLLKLPHRGVATGFHVRHRAGIRKPPRRRPARASSPRRSRSSASSDASSASSSSSSSSSVAKPAAAAPGAGLSCLITAGHAVPTPQVARKTRAFFEPGASATAWPSSSAGASLDPARFFHHDRDADVVVCAFATEPTRTAIACPAVGARRTQLHEGEDQPVHVVHHPQGGAKRVTSGHLAMQTGCAAFFHTAPTAPGSSGAPIFDARFRLLGVHVAGNQVTLGGGRSVRLYEGSRIDGTLRHLRGGGTAAA